MPGEIKPAKDIDAVPIEWLWRQHIPLGMLTCIAGKHKRGKSLLGFHVAADVSRQHNVLISAREDALPQVARPRIEVAGGNLESIHFQTSPGIQLPKDLEYLRQQIIRQEYRLVILDPAVKHGIDIYRLKNLQDTLEPLGVIAQQTGSAILLITHIVKNVRKDAEPIEMIGGANGGLVGTCRAIYILGEGDDADERILADVGSNIAGKRPSLKFEMDIKSFRAARFGDREIEAGMMHFVSESTTKPNLTPGSAVPNPVKREAAAEWLTNYLVNADANCEEKGRLKREIVEDALQYGFTEQVIGRAKYDIGVKCPPAGPNARWWLDKSHPAWRTEDE
jgi:hypothetical protein